MRLYWELAVRGYRRYATYHAATVAGVFTNSVFGFMRAYVMLAVFQRAAGIGGYDSRDAVTYVFIGQGMIMVAYLWGWWDVAISIKSGQVVTDLARPLDFQFYWLAQDLGRATYHAVFRGIPPFVVGALFFDVRLPHNPLTAPAFIVSILLAVCVSFSMRFMVNLTAFWLLDYRGPGRLATAMWTFLSGFIVPISFMPSPWDSLLRGLPFAAIVEMPIQVFLEQRQGVELAQLLLFQAGWAVALLAAGRLLLSAAMRKVVIQGG